LIRGVAGIVVAQFRGAAQYLTTLVLLLLTMGILGLWLVASQILAGQQESAAMLSRIMIRPASAAGVSSRETVITLGRKQLLQNDVASAAAERHVRIHRLQNGVWKISNASANRQLLLEYADGAKYLASRELIGAGLTARLSSETEGDQSLKIELLSREKLKIAHSKPGEAARIYELEMLSTGVRLCSFTAQGTACDQDDGGWFRQAADRIQRLINSNPDGERLLARIGGPQGGLHKRIAHIAVSGVVFDGLRLVWIPRRGFAFAPGRDRTVQFAENDPAKGRTWSIFEIAHDASMSDAGIRLKSFIAGRTRYSVDLDTDPTNAGGLKITPMDAGHRIAPSENSGVGGDLEPFEAPNQAYAISETALPTAAIWKQTLRPRASWWFAALFAVAGVSAIWFMVAACCRLLPPYRWRISAADLFRGLLAGLAVAVWWTSDSLFPIQKGIASPIPPYAAILAWALATLSMFVAQGSGNLMRLIFAVATAIIAAGSYSLLAMGLSADEMHWSRFHNETVGTIAMGATLIALFSAIPTALLSSFADAIAGPGRQSHSWITMGIPISLAFVIVFVFWFVLAVAWFGLGSETGIPGFGQPSEVMKTLFIVIGSSVVTLMVRHRFGARLKPSEGQIFVSVLVLVVILAAQLATPIISHDFSPFLVLALTALLSLFIVMLLHICATWASRLSNPVQMQVAPLDPFGRGARRFIPELRRPGGARRMLERSALWPWRNKYPLLGLVGVPLVLLGFAWGYLAVLERPADIQAYLLDAPDSLRKPAKRLLSWIELDLIHPGQSEPSSDSTPVVEFPDIGLQVMRSRESLGSAPCRIVPTHLKLDRWSAAFPALGVAERHLGQALWVVVDDLLGKVCPRVPESEPVAVNELALPEVQNDFVAAWLVHALGRDGAFALAFLQLALVCLMTAAAFKVMRWRSGDEDRRAASTFLAGTIVGFAMMLFLQFCIAWMNGFGLLPVMGQPMTFVSHGRSHFLFFGVPAILSVMAGLRFMRSEPPRGVVELAPVPMSLGRWFQVRRRSA
jgi:cell division protein FtsW (lipid II flippase)